MDQEFSHWGGLWTPTTNSNFKGKLTANTLFYIEMLRPKGPTWIHLWVGKNSIAHGPTGTEYTQLHIYMYVRLCQSRPLPTADSVYQYTNPGTNLYPFQVSTADPYHQLVITVFSMVPLVQPTQLQRHMYVRRDTEHQRVCHSHVNLMVSGAEPRALIVQVF